jgi:hypothetical protein
VPISFLNDKSNRHHDRAPIAFVTAISHKSHIKQALVLAESIRRFAGKYKDAQIWAYGPRELITEIQSNHPRFSYLKVGLKSVEIPQQTAWFFGSELVFAPAVAEEQSVGRTSALVFMASDSIVIQEPTEFCLADGVSVGVCPVHHRNISPLYTEALDTYWSRAYQIMNIDESSVFPIQTLADGDSVRPYFNAGCLAVRPEGGLLRRRAQIFLELCQDDVIRRESEQDELKRVFTFQVALVGAILGGVMPLEIIQLSKRYNYPIFFKEIFGSRREFHDITDVATIRYEHFFEEPLKDWDKVLKGPKDKIKWIRERLVDD